MILFLRYNSHEDDPTRRERNKNTPLLLAASPVLAFPTFLCGFVSSFFSFLPTKIEWKTCSQGASLSSPSVMYIRPLRGTYVDALRRYLEFTVFSLAAFFLPKEIAPFSPDLA